MREQLAVAPAETVGPDERLALAAGRMAGRLADFLRRVLPADDASLSAGLAFLDRAAAAASDAPVEPSQPLDRLTDGLALTPCEVDLVLLAGLAEEHEGYADVLRALHPQGAPRPTTGLAAQLLGGSAAGRRALRRLLEAGAARRAGVLGLDGDGPFFSRSLLLAEGLWSALQGIDIWPARLVPEPGAAAAMGLEGWLDGAAARHARAALAHGGPVTVLVSAEDVDVAFERAAALAACAGVTAVRLRLPAAADAELERLLALHALMRGAVPVVRIAALDGPAPAEVPAFAAYPGPVVVAAQAGAFALRGRRALIGVGCESLRPSDLGRMWRAALPALAEHAPLLAARYPVEPAAAREIAHDLGHLAAVERRRPGLEDVAASVRARAGAALGGSVKLRRPTAGWDQLVLPAPRLAVLQEMVDRLLLQERVLDDWRFLAGRPGARGVRALFAGPPGTGKTLSAEVMAAALAVDLLVVDLSRVVSKWIGETEKNLADVFASAERSRAVLLFDEADALFGKRTEVSDAHDRYANLETAYLLARLERFEGLAILSTNLRQNLDPAFTRRLEFVVDFDAPGREERLALWRCHLPPAAPLAADVDLGELATCYPLVGGMIRNAAVSAAFLAAAERRPAVGRAHFVHAIRREYEKAGKAFPGLPAGMRDL